MQKANELCNMCQELAKDDPKHEVQLMVNLTKSTQNRRLRVAVCPWCDGATAEFAEAHAE